VNLHRVSHILAIAAGDHNAHGDADRPAPLKHQPIASAEPVERELEATE
jgi:hypothetical protein